MRTRKKIWIGIGAFVIAGSTAAAGDVTQGDREVVRPERTLGALERQLRSSAGSFTLAQAKQGGEAGEGGERSGGEGGERGGGEAGEGDHGGEAGERGGGESGHGGEGGERSGGEGGERGGGEGGERAQGGEGGEGGGEGGEGGIRASDAARDPVEYGIALQVIAAHYYAGLAAYEAKQHEAGAQMFAHGLSEVYVEMEDVFRERGVTGLGDRLNTAVDAAASNAPVAKVKSATQKVLAAIEEAGKKGPKSSLPAPAVKTKVVVEMLERAASQYAVSVSDPALEPYLDGLGFAVAARREAQTALPWLRKRDAEKAKTIEAALRLADKAYPGIARPKSPPVDKGEFLAAASAAKFAAADLR
jgi:hypothetical protein